VGDILGNPEYDNVGDPAGAFQAYGKMAEAAKFLYDADPADVRALSDYGIALLRLGLVTPSAGPAKRETFERSHEMLTRAAVHNPQSSVVAAHKTWVESELAVLFLRGRDHASGMRSYQMAIATAEGSLRASPNDSSTQKGLVVAVRGLAEEQARMGARADALATLDGALRLGKAIDAAAPASSLLLRVNVARAWQAAGSVYAILGSRERDPHAAQDRDAGRQWYQRALDEWRRLETLKGFQPPLRKEMEAAMQALGASR
jgi:tetratricopeptide (TPR) repeat protein